MTRKKPLPLLWKSKKVGTVEISYEEQYPHDMLYHPSPSIKRFEKMIVNEDFNPSKREQRTLQEILDDTHDDPI